MKFIREKIDEFKSLSEHQRKRLAIGLFAFIIPAAYLSGLFSPGAVNRGIWASVLYGLFTWDGIKLTLLCYVILLLLFYFLANKKGLINPVTNVDYRGVKFLQDGTTGSSNWMSKQEAEEVFEVGNIENIKETVFGQFTTDGKEVVAYKDVKTGGTKNTFVLGSPGTGKSFSHVRTAAIQAILRGESVCLTDPSSELYTSLAYFAKTRGANVRVLNFVNPKYSDAWACLYECVTPETGRVSALRLQEFCDIFMRNSGSVNSGRNADFWGDSALNLMQAMVGYTAWKHETDLILGYTKLIKNACRLAGLGKVATMEYLGDVSLETGNLVELRHKYFVIGQAAGYTEEEINRHLAECESYATPFTIGEVYQALLNMGDLKDVRQRFGTLPFNHPGAISFMTFDRQGVAESVKASAQQGLLLRMKLFMDEDIRRITSNKSIDLERMGREQTVCFLITPDNNDAMKPLQALFFSFLFKDLSEAYDQRQAECEKLQIPNERLGVTVLLDEAHSNGIISNFGTALATIRKRKVYVTMYWQTIGQVIDLYGPNMADTIKSCCDIMLFLGTGDLRTAQYVSDFSGTATVQSQSYREMAPGLFGRRNMVTEITASEKNRPVLTVDEALAIREEVIVIRRGYQHVLRLRRFGYIEHPAYKKGLLLPSSIFDHQLASDQYGKTDSISGGLQLREIGNGIPYIRPNGTMAEYLGHAIPLPGEDPYKGPDSLWDDVTFQLDDDEKEVISEEHETPTASQTEVQEEAPVQIDFFGDSSRGKKKR